MILDGAMPDYSQMEGWGPRLRALVEEQGMTLRQVDAQLGFKNGSMSRYTREKREPAASRIVQLARLLRTTAEAIMLGSEQAPPLAVDRLPNLKTVSRMYEEPMVRSFIDWLASQTTSDLDRGEWVDLVEAFDAKLRGQLTDAIARAPQRSTVRRTTKAEKTA